MGDVEILFQVFYIMVFPECFHHVICLELQLLSHLRCLLFVACATTVVQIHGYQDMFGVHSPVWYIKPEFVVSFL
jgi:hypothetical protein